MGCGSIQGTIRLDRISQIDKKVIQRNYLEILEKNSKNDDPLLQPQYLEQMADLRTLKEKLLAILKARPDPLRSYKMTLKRYLYYLETFEWSVSNQRQEYLRQSAIPDLKQLIRAIKYPFLLYKSALNFLTEQPEKLDEVTNAQSPHLQKLNDVIRLLDSKYVYLSAFAQTKPACYAVPLFVLDTLKRLKEYYQKELDALLDQLLAVSPSDVKDLATKLGNEGICELRGPLFGNYVVKNSVLQEVMMGESPLLKENQLKIQRVNFEDLQFYQRYLLIYVFNKFLFRTNILPSIVLRTRLMQADKPKKQRTNFLISLLFPSSQPCYSITEFSVTQEEQQEQDKEEENKKSDKNSSNSTTEKHKQVILLAHNTNKNVKIKNDSFLHHVFASLTTIHLEYYIPNFVVTDGGDMYRVAPELEKDEKRQQYAAIKTPLLFFKQYLTEHGLQEKDLLSSLMDNKIDYDQLLLRCLQLLWVGQTTDFQDANKAQSSTLFQQQLQGIKDAVHRFNLMYAWLVETVFPFTKEVFISQLIDKQQHIMIEIAMRNVSKSVSEHITEMKKIEIQQFLLKTVDRKVLTQYLESAKHFDDDKLAEEYKLDQANLLDFLQWVVEQIEVKKKKENAKMGTYISQVTIQKTVKQIQQASFLKEIFSLVCEKADLQPTDLPLYQHTGTGGCLSLPREVWQGLFEEQKIGSIKDQNQNESMQNADKDKITVLKLKQYEDKQQSIFFQRDIVKSQKRKDLGKASLQCKFGLVKAKDVEIVFEENPNYPGIEIATQMLLVQLSRGEQKMDRVVGRINGVTYLISKNKVGCKTLTDLLQVSDSKNKNTNAEIEKQLDLDSLSDRIITNMILYPGKEAPEDVLLVPSNSNKKQFKLEFIGDATRCFAMSNFKFSREGPCNLGVKSVLFCMDYMHRPIAASVFDKFCKMIPKNELQKYYEEVIALSVKLYYMREKSKDFHNENYHIECSEELRKRSCLGVPFMYTQTRLLYQRFYRIHQFLNFKKGEKGSVTHQQLFEFVDPQLAQTYRIVSTMDAPLAVRFKQIEEELSNIPTFLENFNIDYVERAEHMKLLQQCVDSGQHIGATHCLSKLHKYAGIVPDDQKSLQDIVSSIQNSDVVTLAEHCPCLSYIDLSNSLKLTSFNNGKTIFLQSEPLVFQALKTLILDGCTKLSIVDVQSSHLMNISLNQCVQLQLAFTRCKKLSRVSALDCNKLKEENIIVWIIQGVEVALNQKTSNSYFKEILIEQKKHLKSDQMQYENQVLRLFGQIYVKIDQSDGLFQKSGTGVFSTRELIKFIKREVISISLDRVTETRHELIRFLLLNPNVRTLRIAQMSAFFSNKESVKETTTMLKLLVKVIKEEKEKKDSSRLQDNLFENIDFSQTKFSISAEHYQLALEIIALLKGSNGSSKGVDLILHEKLTKTEIKAISEHISNFNPPLQLLNLSNIQITTASGLPEELKNLLTIDQQHLQLTKLFMQNCGIDDPVLNMLSEGFQKNRTVKILDISSNKFTTVGLNSLLQAIQQSKYIHTLNASNNNLQNTDFLQIKSIRNLTLEQANLSESDFIKLGELLEFTQANVPAQANSNENRRKKSQQIQQTAKCPLLQLNVSKNVITLPGLLAFAKSLSRNDSLKELIFNQTFDLSNTNESRTSMIQSLVESLSQNKSLALIELGSNQLQDTGLLELSKIFQTNQTLKSLHIPSDNTITQKGVESFVKNLGINSQLSSILLNDFHQSEIEDLARKINPQLQLNLLQQHLQPNYASRKMGKIDHCILGLSIDGGGMRGVIPATIIEHFCERTKLDPHKIFSVIGGTSIGGILTLGITTQNPNDPTRPILERDQIVKMLIDEGPNIFTTGKIMGIINNLRDMAKYPSTGIENVLSNYFQNQKLSDVLPGVSAIVTAVKREMKQGDSIAKVFKSTEALFDEDKNFLAKDVARATSAAPSFFPSAEITNLLGKKYSLIDGGVGQNNPAKFVLEELQKNARNEGDAKNFYLISLGTGMPRTDSQLAKNAGIANLLNILESYGESCSDYVDYEIKENYSSNYLRIQTNLNMTRNQAALDNCKSSLVNQYIETAKQVAVKEFSENAKYGRYGDRTLVDWFIDNTDKKKDYYI